MDKQILKVFNAGHDEDLQLSEVRGGTSTGCLFFNCASDSDSCNLDVCSPDEIQTPPSE